MPHITRDSLLPLETYAKQRPEFRARVLAHKKSRTLPVGNHITLIFEDELTVRYQVQEMLRIERAFEEDAILDELAVYNPLVPDGTNWKATMMIEYPDEAERRARLAELKGVEGRVWVQADGHDKVFAIADEDLERENADKTSSVHFLRFELPEATRQALRQGAPFAVGIDHPNYEARVKPVPAPVAASLVGDLA